MAFTLISCFLYYLFALPPPHPPPSAYQTPTPVHSLALSLRLSHHPSPSTGKKRPIFLFFFIFWGGGRLTLEQMLVQRYVYITLALYVDVIDTNTLRQYSCQIDLPAADIILNFNQRI